MTAGQALKVCRIIAKMPQKELANKLGISTSYLSLIESGDREMTVSLLQKAAEEMAIPPALLFEIMKIKRSTEPGNGL
jgi:transcriptional regulator with XRE-family HTH domain